MADFCSGLITNPKAGDKCTPGYVIGVIVSETKLAPIAEADASLQTTYDALALADKPERTHVILFDVSEPGDPEAVPEDLTGGISYVVLTKTSKDMYKVIGDECAYKSIYAGFKTGKIAYLYYIMSGGAIRGKEVTTNTLEQIAAYLHASYEKGKDTQLEKVTLMINEREDFYSYVKNIGIDFIPQDLQTVASMTFELVSASTTEIKVKAWNLCNREITDLTDGISGTNKFIVLDAGGSPVSVAVTKSGNEYTITGTFTTSTTIQVGYEAPSVSSEYYEIDPFLDVDIP